MNEWERIWKSQLSWMTPEQQAEAALIVGQIKERCSKPVRVDHFLAVALCGPPAQRRAGR